MRIHLLSTIALVATFSLVGCSGDDGGGETPAAETDTGAATTDTGSSSGDDTGTTPTDTGSSSDDTGTTPTDTGTTPTDTGTTPTDTGAAAPTFTQVYSTIIEMRCRGCHSGGSPSGSLNMSNKTNAYNNLVGKPAAGGACGGKGTRVVAGDASKSILYAKVTTPTCGNRMPAGGAPALSKTDTDRIKDWINAGAKND